MKANLAGELQVMDALKSGKIRVDKEGRIWRGNKRAENRTSFGYFQIRVMKNGFRAHTGAHRIVYRALIGDIPVGLTVNHKNGKKDDNRPENLELATYSEQAIHSMLVLGNNQRLLNQDGEKNAQAKLTNQQVEQIRAEYAASAEVTQAMLAAKYGVSFQQISKIVRGERRKNQSGAVSDYSQRRNRPQRKNSLGQFV